MLQQYSRHYTTIASWSVNHTPDDIVYGANHGVLQGRRTVARGVIDSGYNFHKRLFRITSAQQIVPEQQSSLCHGLAV